jgi:DNA-binding MarR family transcriptional regulator
MSSELPSEADFGLLFALAFRCYVDHLHAQLAEGGFPPARSAFGPVLRALHARETTLTALAAELDVSKQAVGRVVDDMREANLVSQRPDPSDRRARILALTEQGKAMVEAAIAIGTEYEQALAAELGTRGARELRTALQCVVERSGAGAELAARRVRSI